MGTLFLTVCFFLKNTGIGKAFSDQLMFDLQKVVVSPLGLTKTVFNPTALGKGGPLSARLGVQQQKQQRQQQLQQKHQIQAGLVQKKKEQAQVRFTRRQKGLVARIDYNTVLVLEGPAQGKGHLKP